MTLGHYDIPMVAKKSETIELYRKGIILLVENDYMSSFTNLYKQTYDKSARLIQTRSPVIKDDMNNGVYYIKICPEDIVGVHMQFRALTDRYRVRRDRDGVLITELRAKCEAETSHLFLSKRNDGYELQVIYQTAYDGIPLITSGFLSGLRIDSSQKTYVYNRMQLLIDNHSTSTNDNELRHAAHDARDFFSADLYKSNLLLGETK